MSSKLDRLMGGLFEAAPDATLCVDADGAIVLVNAQTERLFGYPRDELVGRQIAVLVPEVLPMLHGQKQGDYLTNSGPRPTGAAIDLAGQRRDGSVFPLEISLSTIDTDDGVVVTAAVRDVTDRKRGEQLLREQNAADMAIRHQAERALLNAFEKQRADADRLRQLDKIRNEMVSTISHELRTPLTSVTGYLETLEAGDAGQLNEKQHHVVGVIQRNAGRLGTIVDDLLILFQLEDPTASDLRQRIAVRDLVSVIVDEFRPTLALRGQRLTLGSVPPTLEVSGDRAQLERVLDNLLSNASKFTPEAGCISVTVESDRGEVSISVSDSGIGIPAAEQDRLFDRFFRASTAIENAIGGTGLGLAIVKNIADRHRGRLGVVSEKGHGTTFTLTLPAAVPDEVPSRVDAPSKAAQI